MIPRQPPRPPQLGFLYVPPYRVQGLSIAGEASAVHVPELDLCFDMGHCPRPALAAEHVALSHGHMDHSAALAYYFSQRWFQGLGTGAVVAHPDLVDPIQQLMRAWVRIEGQRTPYRVIGLGPDEELEIKNKTFLRAVKSNHTPGSLAYVVLERRSKLLPELAESSQQEIVARKRAGEAITYDVDVPLICYTGDTAWGPLFQRRDVLESRILVTECTFMEHEDRRRADAGKHLFIDDVVRLLEMSSAEAVILTHVSRRTQLADARKRLARTIPEAHRERVWLLMDNKTNAQRYERQKAEDA